MRAIIKQIFLSCHLLGVARYVRNGYRLLVASLRKHLEFLRLRANYHRVLIGLRREYKKRKLRVVFVIGDPVKWKCQYVYDRMLASDCFDPYVAPTLVDAGFFEERFLYERVKRCRRYFRDAGLRCVDVVSESDLKTRPFSECKADIVIYQQPWGMSSNQSPAAVSKYALTYYVPYYISAVGLPSSQVASMFHRSLYANFIENSEWIECFKNLLMPDFRLSKMIPCGNPFREELENNKQTVPMENMVIYAPHWTFPQKGLPKNEVYSTFLVTGRFVLDYAKTTKNVKWVFKPHPVLRDRLIQSRVWTEDAVDAYYSEWARIGEVCNDGSYATLFARSRAMITDSLSFLSEYLIMNRPLIRIEQDEEPVPMLPPAQIKLDGMYRVKTIDELKRTLDIVVMRNEDPMRELRSAVVCRLGFDKNDISQVMIDAIIKDIDK